MPIDKRAEQLLLAIRATPDDTELRLVLADHLASDFPAHAAWIVAQCTGNEDRGLRADFDAELPAALRGLLTSRGFVDHDAWRFDAARFAELDPDVLFRLAPTCTTVRLRDATDVGAIAPRLRRFETLALVETNLGANAARTLADADGLEHLRHLDLAHARVDDENLEPVLRGTGMPRLERLTLGGVAAGFSSDVFRTTIERSVFAKSLLALDVSSRALPDLVEAIRGLPRLRELAASYSPIDASFASLRQRFEHLDLSYCQIDDDAIRVIAGSKVLSELRTLVAPENPWTSEGFATLISSPTLGPLRELTFGPVHAPGGATLAAAFGRSPARATLEQLMCLGVELDEDGVRILASTDFPRLRSLSFYGCALGRDIRVLASAPWFPRLTSLGIGASDLTATSARKFAAALGDTTQLYLMGHVSRSVWAPLHKRLQGRLIGAPR